MRLWSIPAVLAALLSATAAQACFFKCCFKSSKAVTVQKEYTTTLTSSFLTIGSVDGFSIDMSVDPNVQGEVDSAHNVDVVVYCDYVTGQHANLIDLVLTEIGPRTTTAVAKAAAAPKHHTPVRVVLLDLPLPASGTPVVGTGTAPAATTTKIWEVHFTLLVSPTPELRSGFRYTVQALYPSISNVPSLKSDVVSFVTKR